jgi:hypothetical protein
MSYERSLLDLGKLKILYKIINDYDLSAIKELLNNVINDEPIWNFERQIPSGFAGFEITRNYNLFNINSYITVGEFAMDYNVPWNYDIKVKLINFFQDLISNYEDTY